MHSKGLHPSHSLVLLWVVLSHKTFQILALGSISACELKKKQMICHHISGPAVSGPGGPFMFNITGLAGPLMLS